MFRIALDYAASFIFLAAAIITLVLFYLNFLTDLKDNYFAPLIFIIILFIWFFVENIILKSTWGRERKYAQIFGILSDGYDEIHNLYRENDSIESIINACNELCNCVSKSLSIITGSSCNASIKILIDNNDLNKAEITTFSRSRNNIRKKADNDHKHYIEDNTDFKHILENINTPRGEYFFSNQLVFRYNYINSSFKYYGQPDPNPLLRYIRWPLPYKSTIVVPICNFDNNIIPKKESRTNPKLVGFFCVDSNKMGVFKKITISILFKV
jgi:hypothetical protein